MDKVLSSADMTVLRNNCLAEEEYTDLALFFKMFADPTRLKILDALAKRELCVQDLCVLLEMQQSAVSHQLATLRQSRLLRYEKRGKQVYYALNDEHIMKIFQFAYEHIKE